MSGPRVLILLGGRQDEEVAGHAVDVLKRLEVPHQVRIASPHEAPERLAQIVKDSSAQVLLTVASAGSGLPAAVAALTMRPVVAVPVSGDATGPMMGLGEGPSGVHVAMVGVDRGENAALVAASVLALSDERVQQALAAYRETQRERVIREDEALQSGSGGP